jgi:NEDD8-activating enzyme E1
MDLFTPQLQFQICTITNTPRIPEHCIAYAFMVQWDQEKDHVINKDSPEDMRWIYEKALKRAVEFNIEGVTYFKTLGLVKNIIPAIASTNAIVSAAAVNEVLKLVTFCGQTLNSYYSYIGDLDDGIYSQTFAHQRKDDCLDCGLKIREISITPATTLEEFRQMLHDDPTYQLKNTSIRTDNNDTLYMPNIAFRTLNETNSLKPMSEFVKSGDIVNVTSSELASIKKICVRF